MNGQYLMNKQVSVQYAYKKDGKGERHGDQAERTLAAQARKHNLMPHQVGFGGQQQQQQQTPLGFPQRQPQSHPGFQPLTAAAPPSGFAVPSLQQPMQTGFGSAFPPTGMGVNGVPFTAASRPPSIPAIPQQSTAIPFAQRPPPPPGRSNNFPPPPMGFRQAREFSLILSVLFRIRRSLADLLHSIAPTTRPFGF